MTGAFNKNPQRRNTAEPKPSTDRPTRPKHLTGHAGKEWSRVTKILADMRLLTKSDCALLEVYCHTFGQWRDDCDKVKKYGSVLLHKADGKTRAQRSPWDISRERNASLVIRMLTELGLTPSSRSRVIANSDEDDDPFTRYLQQRGMNN